MREVAGFDEGVGGGACGSVYKAGLCMVVKRMKEKNKNKKNDKVLSLIKSEDPSYQ